MVTINLKVSMCRDTIANSNMTKAYVINPCDSCNNDVNTPLNAIHVHIQVNKKFRKFERKHRDCIKRKGDKIGTQTCYDIST